MYAVSKVGRFLHLKIIYFVFYTLRKCFDLGVIIIIFIFNIYFLPFAQINPVILTGA